MPTSESPCRRNDPRHSSLASLERWLEAERIRSGAQAVALSDGYGMLVAGVGGKDRCDELAATAPLAARTRGEGVRSIPADSGWLHLRWDLAAEPPMTLAAGCVRILLDSAAGGGTL